MGDAQGYVEGSCRRGRLASGRYRRSLWELRWSPLYGFDRSFCRYSIKENKKSEWKKAKIENSLDRDNNKEKETTYI